MIPPFPTSPTPLFYYHQLTGSHIKVQSSKFGIIDHHGIVWGVDENGVLFVAHNTVPGGVQVSPFSQFTTNRTFELLATPSDEQHRQAILARVRQAITNRTGWYLVFNCEHFANWAFHGEAESQQFRTGLAIAATLGVCALAASPDSRRRR